MQETIQEIAKNIGVGVSEIIPYYVKWYFAASIIWLLTGLSFIALGFFMLHKLWNYDDKHGEYPARIWVLIAFAVCLFIGFLFIGCNIGDFVSPEGIAYHRLISDIRGN